MNVTIEQLQAIESEVAEVSEEEIEELLDELRRHQPGILQYAMSIMEREGEAAAETLLNIAVILCKAHPGQQNQTSASDLALVAGLHNNSDNKPSPDDQEAVRKMLKTGFGWKLKSETVADYLTDVIFEVGEDPEFSAADREMLLVNLVAIAKALEEG